MIRTDEGTVFARRRLVWGVVLAACVGAALSAAWPSAPVSARQASSSSEPLPVLETASAESDRDPRVLSFLEAYDGLVDSVSYLRDDVVFYFGEQPIYFQDGRMLSEADADRRDRCAPIFYPYPLGPLKEIPPPPPEELPTYCQDLLESLWGRTETEIRRHGRSIRFLDHRMFVNELVVAALSDVEVDLVEAARRNADVAAWIDELDVTYSFIDREIAGSENRSHHAWGMAVDFVPRSYEGQAVYWRWSRALDREGWYRIPVEGRWSPPGPVVEIFERHGFVWGGKWSRFDNIHFEYRPEIIGYARRISRAAE